MVFPVVIYGCESWTAKKAEHRRIDAFELWCWRTLARDGVSREVPCSALKGETVPDSLPATPKCPPTRRVPWRGHKDQFLPNLLFDDPHSR